MIAVSPTFSPINEASRMFMQDPWASQVPTLATESTTDSNNNKPRLRRGLAALRAANVVAVCGGFGG